MAAWLFKGLPTILSQMQNDNPLVHWGGFFQHLFGSTDIEAA